MVVLIVNLTDASECKYQPTQVDIYNKTLDPGGTLRIPAGLVDKNIRALESRGIISIGQIPSWYANAKATKARSLSPEEKAKRITIKRVVHDPPRNGSKKNTLAVVEELQMVSVRR